MVRYSGKFQLTITAYCQAKYLSLFRFPVMLVKSTVVVRRGPILTRQCSSCRTSWPGFLSCSASWSNSHQKTATTSRNSSPTRTG